MAQMNPKEVFHNTAYSVQLPYIAGPSLKSLKNPTTILSDNEVNLCLRPNGKFHIQIVNKTRVSGRH